MSSSGLVFAMGIDPGYTSGWAVIGVHERTMYRNDPGRIRHFEYGDVTGNFSNQAVTLANISREFYPLALVVESFTPRKPITSEEYLSPVKVAARIEFCVETHYITPNLFWQTPTMAMETATDARLKLWDLYVPGPDHIKDATRHAITFIRRCKEKQRRGDLSLMESAWGQYVRPHDATKRRPIRSRRTLYLRDVRPEGRQQMDLGFTGTRRGMSKAQMKTLHQLMVNFTIESGISEFHHGCCDGSDRQSSYIAAALGVPIVIGHPGKLKPVGYWDELLARRDNLVRNEDIVKASDLVIATPWESKEIMRSGTWQAIRRARTFNVPLIIIWRDGSTKEEL